MKEPEGRRCFRVMQDDPCKCAGLFHVWLLMEGEWLICSRLPAFWVIPSCC